MSKNNFNVNTDIYPPQYILQAIDDFDGYVIHLDPHSSIVHIDDENSQYVFDELMNHTLSLILE